MNLRSRYTTGRLSEQSGPAVSQADLNKFRILNGELGEKERHAIRHGEFNGLMESAMTVARKVAAADAKKAAAAAKSIYGATTISVADAPVTVAYLQASPRTILSETISGFREGGFSATFDGFIDNTATMNSCANIIMLLNGVQVAKYRIGVWSPTANITVRIPFSMSAVFKDDVASPSIVIRAYASDQDDEATAAYGFVLRGGRLSISGAQ
jgi:hypothetical protein